MITFRETLKQIKRDMNCHGGISLKNKISVYFFNASFRLLLNYRIGRYLKQRRGFFVNLLVQRFEYRQITKRNCHISFKAVIGANFRFAHPIGVVIGENVVIGDDVRIWQDVTLGSHGKKHLSLVYPEVGNGVKIFAGAKIFGGIKIGEGAVIGANSVVNRDIPSHAKAVGIPVRILEI
jgi:serine O-acetyltransferase